MANKAQQLIDTLATMGYKDSTDLENKFSYGNGVVNFLGVNQTGITLGISIKNQDNSTRRVAICTTMFKGKEFDELHRRLNGLPVTATDVLEFPAIPFLPAGIVPFFDYSTPKDDLTITSMDADQDLELIAKEATVAPFFISKLHMRSYKNSTGELESSNFSEVIQHYFATPWKGDRPADKLELAKFQKGTDYHLTIEDIDFVEHRFPSLVSANDILVFSVRPGTELQLMFNIAARDSRPEFFQRQMKSGMQMLGQLKK